MTGRKIAVLGDMRELGEYEQEGHSLVGLRAAEVADVVIAVGNLGKLIGDAAKEQGKVEVQYAADNASAVDLIRKLATPGDVMLIKGSAASRWKRL